MRLLSWFRPKRAEQQRVAPPPAAAARAAGPRALLRQLEASVLFAEDFPRRARISVAQWASLPQQARLEAERPAMAAIERARATHKALADIVKALGVARYDPAVPLLAKLWHDCPLVPVRTPAGYALRAIGSPAARSALVELIDDADELSVVQAVRAIFDADPAQAFEKLADYFRPGRIREPGGTVVPAAVLATFGPTAFRTGPDGKEEPLWFEERARDWFIDDVRWVALCVQLRRHQTLGEAARAALRYADPEIVRAASDTSRVAAARSAPVGDLVARYRRGEHEAVWSELRIHAAIDGGLREEALAVARHTMSRVARSADLLAERLAAHGWTALFGSLRPPPGGDDDAVMRRIEDITGALLPPSLRAFWEVVGGIDFIWNYEKDDEIPLFGLDLPIDEMDPLAVCPARESAHVFEEWEDRAPGRARDLDEPYTVMLAPGRFHKADISGGAPYGIELPFAGADPVFGNEDLSLPFVDYLRLCFRWGGFPHLAQRTHESGVREFVAKMTEGLEPF
jgi:hypothetical protein